MPRVLAVDWGHREVRCLLASVTGSRVKLHLAASAPLATEAEANHEASAAEISLALRNMLASERVSRQVTVVGVNRAMVELLDLTLPPAKDSELPELVLHQAMHESTVVTEEAGVDFFALSGDASQPRKVTVAALPADQRERIHAVCDQAELKPNRIVLRSYASTSLFHRMRPDAERVCLLVDRVGDEADLTLMVEGRAVFLRTIRLPTDHDVERSFSRLLAEIRRTLAVSLEDHGAETVEAIYVFGRQDQHEELVGRIARELEVPASTFDVFQAAGVPAELVPEDTSSFAALLGMVLDESQGSHLIDFCRTRKPSGPSPAQRRLILAAVAAVALAIGGSYYVWNTLAEADAQIKGLAKQLKDLNTLLKKGSDQNKVVEAVHEWLAGDVTWLDELRDLSIRFPRGRDMIVLRMTLSAAPKSGGGDVDLQGVVRDPSVVVRMENNVRDKFHEIGSKRVQERVRQRMYSWHFETSMSVAKRDKSQYLSHLPEPSTDTVAASAESEKRPFGSRRPVPVTRFSANREEQKPSQKPALAADSKPAAAETRSTDQTKPPAEEQPAARPSAGAPQPAAAAEKKSGVATPRATAEPQPATQAKPPAEEPPKNRSPNRSGQVGQPDKAEMPTGSGIGSKGSPAETKPAAEVERS